MMKAQCSTLCAGVLAGVIAIGCAEEPPAPKIPITTRSDEARRLYLEGQALQDRVRTAEAREAFRGAVELDPSFARAQLALSGTSVSGKEFWESLNRAVALADHVSRGERELILARHASVLGKHDAQFGHLSKLVELYPDDERARTALGNWYFGRHEWGAAIDQYRKATELAPEFSGPYNQLGYAHRYLRNWKDAEAAFQSYIRVLPGEPNPYDSYAELLMKTGRFTESIETYRKALEIDPRFAPSYIGIANDYVFLGNPEAARETLARLEEVARNDAVRRRAILWTAATHLHEGNAESALAELERRHAIAEAEGDITTMAGDLRTIGDVLLHAGRTDEALRSFEASLASTETADVPDDVKHNAARRHAMDRVRLHVARNDLDLARDTLEDVREAVLLHNHPFEIRMLRYLEGLVAYQGGAPDVALQALERADHENPRVLHLLALAHRDTGNVAAAYAAAERAAHFNAIDFDYAFVRGQAQALLAELTPN